MELMIKNMFVPEGKLIDTAENKASIESLGGLFEAEKNETVLEARAGICDYSHNLIIDLPCAKGIIPRSEGAVGISEGYVRDIALISRVGKPVAFTVSEIHKNNNSEKPVAVLSRRRAQEKCIIEYADLLEAGDVINAKITHLEPFGAFCDIGCGVAALLPIDCISVSRISHPSDRFLPGEDIKAVVKSRDNLGRLNLSHKELLGTWEENAEMFYQGETVSGTVRTVESYGSFIELTPNLAGLAEPREGVAPGQRASVYIKSIIPEKMKIKLIIIDTYDDNYTPSASKYFFDGNHMDKWVYSPEGCEKYSVTEFDDSEL